MRRDPPHDARRPAEGDLRRASTSVDAFVGMVSEPHVRGTEFGELQLAIWKKQFEALRDGDRFFYLNDPALSSSSATYGIDYRKTLAEIIKRNTGVDVARTSSRLLHRPGDVARPGDRRWAGQRPADQITGG